LVIDFNEPVWGEFLHGLLSQYDAPWATRGKAIQVLVENDSLPSVASGIAGRYLTLQRLRVDCVDGRLVSIGQLGSRMEFEMSAGRARVSVPPHPDSVALVEEIEQQFVLLLARAWAQAGWAPLHTGTLVPPGDTRCVLLCAPSGSGKTTLTASLLRRGWRTLGDDKTLLRVNAGVPFARALARRFHLHPEAAGWFPEAGDLTAWPRYSRWTDKRVVQVEKLWPGRLLGEATPAALLQVERRPGGPAVTVLPLDAPGVLNALLRQVVIPGEPAHARPLVNCVAETASRLRGARILMGHNAFSEMGVAEEIEQALRSLIE
jgi:hypothetical protein